MKKLLVILALGLFSCGGNDSSTDIPIDADEKEFETKFQVLEENVQIKSGYISVYLYGTDTLYVVEGRSSSYPIGVSVK